MRLHMLLVIRMELRLTHSLLWMDYPDPAGVWIRTYQDLVVAGGGRGRRDGTGRRRLWVALTVYD